VETLAFFIGNFLIAALTSFTYIWLFLLILEMLKMKKHIHNYLDKVCLSYGNADHVKNVFLLNFTHVAFSLKNGVIFLTVPSAKI